MTETEVIRVLRGYYEGLFPKHCSNCGRTFATLGDYIVATQPLWPSVAYEIEMGDFEPRQPIDGLAMANCVCGNTLALSSSEMPLPQTRLLLEWIRTETERRSLKPSELLDHLRKEVRRQVLADSTTEGDTGTGESPTA
jgi:hypothetical protein